MLIRFFSPRLHTADTGVQGGAGGNGGAAGNAGADPQSQSLQNLLARNNGDATAMAAQLFSENYSLRDRNRQLQSAAPAEGSLVLTKEQAAHWTAYQALGAPDAITQQVQAAQTAAQELDTLKRGSLLRDVAAVQSWDADVLGDLPGAADLAFAIRDVTVDGKPVKAAVVTPKGGAEMSLTDYAAQKWAKFLPALAVQQQGGQGAAVQQGTRFPAQQGSGQQQTGTSTVTEAAKRFQDARDKAPSPLAAFGKK